MNRKTVPARKSGIAATIAGIILLSLSTLLLTGMITFSPGINNAVIKGNRYYAKGEFDKALAEYKKGLSEKEQDPMLNFNAGQAAYRLKNYQQAVSYYDKASDTVDKYLNSGNSCCKLGENARDPAQALKMLQQALELYRQGIVKFPQNIPLKYNYELTKSKVDELKKNTQNQQDQKDQKQDKQNQDKNKDKNDQQQNQDKDGSGKDKQNQQKNNQSKQQESSQPDKKDNSKKTTGQESSGSQDNTKDSKLDKNNSEVMQVLEMLEKQEENSLKNNQEVKGKGKEDKYDW